MSKHSFALEDALVSPWKLVYGTSVESVSSMDSADDVSLDSVSLPGTPPVQHRVLVTVTIYFYNYILWVIGHIILGQLTKKWVRLDRLQLFLLGQSLDRVRTVFD